MKGSFMYLTSVKAEFVRLSRGRGPSRAADVARGAVEAEVTIPESGKASFTTFRVGMEAFTDCGLRQECPGT
ncbi:hypothetical protein DMC63_23995 [Streptomyces sp. WAC 05977]|nr:hypothetical protein DMC63_23995 [Streptomyces sp. WAC 05977]